MGSYAPYYDERCVDNPYGLNDSSEQLIHLPSLAVSVIEQGNDLLSTPMAVSVHRRLISSTVTTEISVAVTKGQRKGQQRNIAPTSSGITIYPVTICQYTNS